MNHTHGILAIVNLRSSYSMQYALHIEDSNPRVSD